MRAGKWQTQLQLTISRRLTDRRQERVEKSALSVGFASPQRPAARPLEANAQTRFRSVNSTHAVAAQHTDTRSGRKKDILLPRAGTATTLSNHPPLHHPDLPPADLADLRSISSCPSTTQPGG